jgi:predicted nucleotidyltransferase
MNTESTLTLPTTATLPTNVSTVLGTFIAAAKKAFADDLLSVVLYGSGAEGKLRPTSDVNLILVLAAFNRDHADQLREPLRLAEAAIRLRTMFLLQDELKPASQAFAVKFGDIARRRLVLYGSDPFVWLLISRDDAIFRLRQTLLNVMLRLRETYIARSLREEQLAIVIADAAGPLRSCASTLLELEGRQASSPKEALEQVAASLANRPDPRQRVFVNGEGKDFVDPKPDDSQQLQLITEARQRKALPPGAAAPALFYLIELAQAMWARAAQLKMRRPE